MFFLGFLPVLFFKVQDYLLALIRGFLFSKATLVRLVQIFILLVSRFRR